MNNQFDLTVVDTTTGVAQDNTGIMMLFIQGVAVANTLNLNQAYPITSMTDVAALGINAAYDVTNGTAVFQQLNDFYTQGGQGTVAWLVVVPLNTAYATYVAAQTFQNLIMFTGQADPENQAKMIGLCYAPPTALQSGADFPADVTATVTALQTVLAAMFQAGYQLSAIVDGYNMSSTVTPTAIGTQSTNTAYAVSLCITGTQPNGVSGVGAALGRFARISIGHGFGAVADGTIAATQAFLTNGIAVYPGTALIAAHVYTVFGGAIVYNTATLQPGTQFEVAGGVTAFTSTAGGYVADNCTPVGNIPGTSPGSQIIGLNPTAIAQFGQKQFMFIRTWQNKAGFYWNDGSTCVSPAKSLSSQEYNRVINYLSAMALAFITEFAGSNLPVDASTGALAQGWINNQQELFYDDYIQPLNDTTGTGDLSDGALILTGATFNTTRQITIKLNIVASTILGGASGTAQFVATI